MTNDTQKSDDGIVAMKSANVGAEANTESMERRLSAEGNAARSNTRRTQSRVSVSQGLDRVRERAKAMTRLEKEFLPPAHIRHPWPEERFLVKHPRWEPSALIAPARFCAGGA